MRWASPSTIAVLPTPGSPISTGLFLVRRDSTWITRRISSSRPITGSSLPCSASSVRSRPKRSSAWYLSSGFGSVTRCGPRTSRSAARIASAVRRAGLAPASPCDPASASSRCSVEMNSSFSASASRSAAWKTRTSSPEGLDCAAAAPATDGSLSSAAVTRGRSWSAAAPSFASSGTTMPPSCSSSTASRCSGVISGLPRSCASRCAAWIASWDLIVNLSACIGLSSFGIWTASASVRAASRRRLPRHQLALVRAVHLVDARAHLALHLLSRCARAACIASISSSSSSTRSTPARFMPSSVVSSWMRRSRSTSRCE